MARNVDGSNVGPWLEYDDCEKCKSGLRFDGKCNNCGDVRPRPKWTPMQLLSAIQAGARAGASAGHVIDPDWYGRLLVYLMALADALNRNLDDGQANPGVEVLGGSAVTEVLARLIEEANAVINNASYEPDGPFENGGHHKVGTLEALASATADAEKALGRDGIELLRPRRQLDHEGPGWIDLDGFIRLFSPEGTEHAVLIVRGNPNSPGAVARSLTPGEETAIVACWAADLRRRKVIP